MDERGRVLLGKRGIHPFHGLWNVIGGFLQYGEEPLDGLRREVREELGVECVVEDCVVALADQYGPEGTALVNMYFTVHLANGPIRPQDDVAELAWFPLDALPENMAFESDRKALRILAGKREEPTGAKK